MYLAPSLDAGGAAATIPAELARQTLLNWNEVGVTVEYRVEIALDADHGLRIFHEAGRLG